MGVFNFIVDPYWVWHVKRVYPYNDSLMLHQLVEQRIIKPLQLFMLQPENIIIGSSRVYHVFDVANIDDNEKWYNMGISSLKISEAYRYIEGAIFY